jgi:hypothetical protein
LPPVDKAKGEELWKNEWVRALIAEETRVEKLAKEGKA